MSCLNWLALNFSESKINLKGTAMYFFQVAWKILSFPYTNYRKFPHLPYIDSNYPKTVTKHTHTRTPSEGLCKY